ncbi:tachykinin-3 [Eptesicus fuscus]|uniref:tachykinin-3 n=1 Tax=Eptesicus fuscus TaxID=29078 RepID=UPI002403E71E|nr:tachykinin-3 [Eptesicus fuscus]
MRSALLLAAILALSLPLGAVCEESPEQVVPSRGRREKALSIEELLKALTSHNSVSVVDELLKTLSQASKGDMHDFFVGLMGKRNSQPDTPADGTHESAPRFGSLQYPPNVE